MASRLVSVRLPVPPWLKDHHFNGRIILPAVESMQVLAAITRKEYPELDVRVMGPGRFTRFLEIPPSESEIEIFIELGEEETGQVFAQLLTRKQFKTLTRITDHCELHFGSVSPPANDQLEHAESPFISSCMEISAEQVYRELVPFGPAFQSLQGTLYLGKTSVEATLRSPESSIFTRSWPLLGSPFPMDGAMHAACVHGQSLVDFIPFPVGFTQRIIHKPTLPTESYGARLLLKSHSGDELVYDIQIVDQRLQRCETIKDLRMRDVSAGQLKPPAWIKTLQDE